MSVFARWNRPRTGLGNWTVAQIYQELVWLVLPFTKWWETNRLVQTQQGRAYHRYRTFTSSWWPEIRREGTKPRSKKTDEMLSINEIHVLSVNLDAQFLRCLAVAIAKSESLISQHLSTFSNQSSWHQRTVRYTRSELKEQITRFLFPSPLFRFRIIAAFIYFSTHQTILCGTIYLLLWKRLDTIAFKSCESRWSAICSWMPLWTLTNSALLSLGMALVWPWR